MTVFTSRPWLVGQTVALCAMLFALCVSAPAQQPKKVFRIGYLSVVDTASDSARSESVRQALRRLGYIEEQNIAFEYRYTEGKADRLPLLAAELVRLKVDVIVVAGGNTVIEAVKNATKTIPIVLEGQGGHPVKEGFIESLARPGGNITGVTSITNELGGKRLELLKEVVPKAARVAVLYDPSTHGASKEVNDDLPVAAHALRLAVWPWQVRTAEDFEKVFGELRKERLDAFYVRSSGALMRLNIKRITDFALKSRLPSIYPTGEEVDAGGLMSYAADRADIHQRIAYYVDRILKGAKPANLPVEQPSKFELAINLKTAKQIGVAIPQKVLARADRVIK